ncbi:MAG: class I SAM-dependent methyltransferase [Nitrospiria bacterium]
MSLNEKVRLYWEKEPCGTHSYITEGITKNSRMWYERIEEYRYTSEPFIHSAAQFTRYNGKKILEVGVGAGTDHLQWARAGAICHGVDLTDAAIETTKEHLALFGFQSILKRTDAEILPFSDEFFDVVYSWGVIHHAEHPEKIVSEIQRVLKPGGIFIGMVYKRYSLAALKVWIKHALFKGEPFRSFSNVLFHHVESIGTKAYTIKELKNLFSGFECTDLKAFLTSSDKGKLLKRIGQFIPDSLGWYITVRAIK